MTFSKRTLSLLAVLCLAGCPSGPEPTDAPVLPDGGTDTSDTVDRERPTVMANAPEEGSVDVPLATEASVTFSEPMGPIGTVTVRVEGAAYEEASVALADDTLTITPDAGWPAASLIEIRVGDDFADVVGNTLATEHVFRFETRDDRAPTVVASTPSEGADDVSAQLSAIQIRFDAPMNQAVGTVLLEGGPGVVDVDGAVWGPSQVTYPVSGLANDTSYRVLLIGFEDRAGRALDGGGAVVDGILDFTTRADDEAPRVLSTSPVEGQVDVSPGELGGLLRVTFDEAMDPSVTTVPLTVDGTTTSQPVSWVSDRVASIDVADAIALGLLHRVDLTGMRDVAGNTLAPEPVLGDGHLDFTTGTDAFVPYVVASDPAEGATNVTIPLADVRIAFSEAMDESLDTVELTDGTGAVSTATGVWTSSGTTLVLPATAFVQGRAYQIDVRMLRDRSGSSVSADHPYLGDGRLNFSIARPTGASCAEPLLLELATPFTSGAGVGIPGFLITSAQRTRNNGSGTCDGNGIAETDAVIYVHKTTPALGDPSGEGRALRVRTFNVSNRANIEVFRDVCDPVDALAASARVRCATEHASWDLVLDLPAGDYYVWVSTEAGSPLDIRVAVDEVESLADGASCETAYDQSSTIYTPPAVPDAPHVYEVPSSGTVSADITDTNAPFAAFSCGEVIQDDVVFTHTKVAEDSVLEVFVQPAATSYVEVIAGGCAPDEPGASRAGCQASVTSAAGRRFDVRAPAGPVSIWLGRSSTSAGFGGARVEIRELPAPTAPGTSCATAIPLTPSSAVSVNPDGTTRYDAPSCFGSDARVTWYSFVASEELTHLLTNDAGLIALVDPTSGATTACSGDASSAPLYQFAPAGSTVCVAIESGTPISSLGIEAIDYAGPGALPFMSLEVSRPSLEGSIFSGSGVTGDTWLEVTPTRFYTNLGTAGVIEGPRSPGPSIFRDDVDGRVLGDGATSIGERLFTLDLGSTSGTSSTRLFQLADAAGNWDPIVWDRGASGDYASEFTRSLTTDGTTLLAIDTRSRTEADRAANIYTWPTAAPARATLAGRLDAQLYNVIGLAMDADWVYVLGQVEVGTVYPYGIFRIARSAINPTTPVVPELVHALGTSSPGNSVRMLVDDRTDARYLFFRASGDIHVIENPGGTSRYLGVIHDGVSGDFAMGRDPTDGSLWFFSTQLDPLGSWYRLP